MNDASIVIFATHGVPALRTVLHGIRDTVERPHDIVVFAAGCSEQVATYLLRQYLRGRITGYEVDTLDGRFQHCGLDRAYHLVKGDYLVRVDDTLEFQQGWLDKAIAAMEAERTIGCLSLVQPPDYHRKRGRPPTVHIKPQACASLDMRCYVTRRSLVSRHECELMGEQPGDFCHFQDYLAKTGLSLAYLPGLVKALDLSDVPELPAVAVHEAELPPHEGATGAMQRLEQAYDLGDDVLLTCMACGGTELEVLAARIIFCKTHQVAIGFWYELRCPECNELHYKDDLQFRCPS